MCATVRDVDQKSLLDMQIWCRLWLCPAAVLPSSKVNLIWSEFVTRLLIRSNLRWPCVFTCDALKSLTLLFSYACLWTAFTLFRVNAFEHCLLANNRSVPSLLMQVVTTELSWQKGLLGFSVCVGSDMWDLSAPPAVHVDSPTAFSILVIMSVRPQCDAPRRLSIWKIVGNLQSFSVVTYII